MRQTLMQLALILTGLWVVAGSLVTVDETEFVIVERLGNVHAVYDRGEDRGLHFKLPWPVDIVRRFDSRVHLFDPPRREVFTRDRKNVTVDAFVCWRIALPRTEEGILKQRPVLRFFRSLGSSDVAQARVGSRLRSILTAAVGRVELDHLLAVSDSEAGPGNGGDGVLEHLSSQILQHMIQQPHEQQSLRSRLGVEIVDARIKRLNFPTGNQQAVFDRMKSERRKIADRYRSAGMAQNLMIRSQADRRYEEILARARGDAERIRGRAEADAIALLNKAHSRDPEFHKLLQTLDAYKRILGSQTTLVLSASGHLFRLLSEGLPEPSGTPRPLSRPTTMPVPSAAESVGHLDIRDDAAPPTARDALTGSSR